MFTKNKDRANEKAQPLFLINPDFYGPMLFTLYNEDMSSLSTGRSGRLFIGN